MTAGEPRRPFQVVRFREGVLFTPAPCRRKHLSSPDNLPYQAFSASCHLPWGVSSGSHFVMLFWGFYGLLELACFQYVLSFVFRKSPHPALCFQDVLSFGQIVA